MSKHNYTEAEQKAITLAKMEHVAMTKVCEEVFSWAVPPLEMSDVSEQEDGSVDITMWPDLSYPEGRGEEYTYPKEDLDNPDETSVLQDKLDALVERCCEAKKEIFDD